MYSFFKLRFELLNQDHMLFILKFHFLCYNSLHAWLNISPIIFVRYILALYNVQRTAFFVPPTLLLWLAAPHLPTTMAPSKTRRRSLTQWQMMQWVSKFLLLPLHLKNGMTRSKRSALNHLSRRSPAASLPGNFESVSAAVIADVSIDSPNNPE
jgi:hypothetical protein